MTHDTRILAIANQKGGVAKTTTAVALAAALADSGDPTLLVDLDPQASATLACGFDPTRPYRSLYDAVHAYTQGAPAQLAPYRLTATWHLVPGHINMAGGEEELRQAIGGEYALRHLLAAVAPGYRWIVVDCPPSLGLLAVNALAAATDVLIPIIPDFLSSQGLGQLGQTIRTVRGRVNPGLAQVAVVLTRVQAQTVQHQDMRQQIAAFCDDLGFTFLSARTEAERALGTVGVEIPQTIQAQDAAYNGTPLSRVRGSVAGAAYRSLATLLQEARYAAR